MLINVLAKLENNRHTFFLATKHLKKILTFLQYIVSLSFYFLLLDRVQPRVTPVSQAVFRPEKTDAQGWPVAKDNCQHKSGIHWQYVG